MIEGYRFGQIVVDKQAYTGDVIVFPDYVQGNWWRKEGHLLQWEDIAEVIASGAPEILVVGKGKFGFMRIDSRVKEELEKMKIQLYAEPTEKAIRIYNRLLLTGKKVLGAFHLTC